MPFLDFWNILKRLLQPHCPHNTKAESHSYKIKRGEKHFCCSGLALLLLQKFFQPFSSIKSTSSVFKIVQVQSTPQCSRFFMPDNNTTRQSSATASKEIIAIHRLYFEICRYAFECLLNGGSYSTEILRALSLEIGSFSFHFTILVETSPINLRLQEDSLLQLALLQFTTKFCYFFPLRPLEKRVRQES